jgi:hypothetical protein
MKHIALSVVVLFVAALAMAGTYTLSLSTIQDTRLERDRVRHNKATCGALTLPGSCTQAQARTKDPNANIYSDVSDFLDRFVVKVYTDSLKRIDTSDDYEQFCTWFKAATVAQQNAACTLAALPNGCEICPQ